jgi:hypothetical protein
MNIIVKVPQSVYVYCKDKLKLSDKKISALYKSYVNFVTNQTTHEPIDGFIYWYEENGEECLADIKR